MESPLVDLGCFVQFVLGETLAPNVTPFGCVWPFPGGCPVRLLAYVAVMVAYLSLGRVRGHP